MREAEEYCGLWVSADVLNSSRENMNNIIILSKLLQRVQAAACEMAGRGMVFSISENMASLGVKSWHIHINSEGLVWTDNDGNVIDAKMHGVRTNPIGWEMYSHLGLEGVDFVIKDGILDYGTDIR